MAVKEYDQKTLYKLRRGQLENLKCFIKVCEKHGLHWFLMYGSLIGAVRHGGYIPWDDDLDVGMLREDYDKFVEISHEEIDEGFEVLSVKYERTYQRAFARVQLKGTKYIEPTMEGENTKEGIYIDVFVLDRVPADEEQALDFMRKTSLWQIAFNAMMIKNPQIALTDDDVEAKKRKQWKFIHNFGKYTLFPKHMLYKIYEKKKQRYNREYTGYVADIKGAENAIFKEEWCIDTIPWYFEGIKVQIPRMFDEVLTNIYGSYKYMPHEEYRKNHNAVTLEFGEWSDRLEDGWDADSIDERSTVQNIDSDSCRILVYHFNELMFLINPERAIEKTTEAIAVINKYASRTNNLKVIFSPSGLFEKNLKEISTEVYEQYKNLLGSLLENESVINCPIDSLRDRIGANELAEMCNGSYGVYTSFADEVVKMGKPVMAQNIWMEG